MTMPFQLSPEELTRHATWLRRLAQRLVHGQHEAEDLAQDVWLELAASNRPVTHLRAFTARIARRLAARRGSSSRAREQREARAAHDERLPDPAVLEEHLETQRLLFHELSALDEVHRRPLLLHFYEGLSAAEIARRSGAPETTVRSQIQRSLAELRARLDRRHGGERALWVALLARLPRPDAATVALGGGTLVLIGTVAAVAAIAGGFYFFRQDEPAAAAPLLASAPRAEDRALAPAPGAAARDGAIAPTTVESTREPAARTVPPKETAAAVAILVRDADSGAPLGDFLLELERLDGTRESLTTDAGGRTSLPREWFESSFHVSASGDEEWDDSGLERDLGTEDLPPEGEPLVLACATGPTYALLFDGSAPEPEELFASLSRGERVPDEPTHRATLHRDGARIWTRFAPEYGVRTPKGDEPWTLAVFARDGLWRASAPVETIRGVQAEPVWLAGEACGVLHVRLETDGGPVVGECAATLHRLVDGKAEERWRLYSLVPSGQSTIGGMPEGRGVGVRSLRFPHLPPGPYRIIAGSDAHEWVQRELVVTAGVADEITLDVARKAGMAELRVVITSETGTLPLPPVFVNAREVGTGVARYSRYLPESTSERRMVAIEAQQGVELELTLDGLESLGAIAWSPGTSHIARPGEEVVFTALDVAAPPVRRGRFVVLSQNGEPVRSASVTTYFGSEASFLHDTDADGRVELEPIQEGAPFDVVVVADGYRPQILRALALQGDGETFEVRLRPGWGAWLKVVIGGGPPADRTRSAAGAVVLLDGVEAGRLDEHGHALVERDTAPDTIDIALPGHHIAYGDIDPATLAPPAHKNGPYWVVLEASQDE